MYTKLLSNVFFTQRKIRARRNPDVAKRITVRDIQEIIMLTPESSENRTTRLEYMYDKTHFIFNLF